jgi:iron complex transport system substrate-binding protein
LPIGISRWGHPGSLETPLAILWTAKSVYPDRFLELDMQRETDNFYRNFFNHVLSAEMIAQILNGRGMRLTKNRKQKQQ